MRKLPTNVDDGSPRAERMGQAMKTRRLGVCAVLAAVLITGCQGSVPKRRPGGLAANEPALEGGPGAGSGTAVVEAPPARGRAYTFVDRHPLFFKPREYYESSGDNVIVKGAAATLVGVPVGLVGEMRQIVVGRPPDNLAGSY
jgi:hypothetical protein